MTTPAILKSNLRAKLGKDILLEDNPTVKDVMANLAVTREENRKDVEGILPKYLYSSLGLIGAGTIVFVAKILNVPAAEVVPFITAPLAFTGGAAALALSIGVPMYENFKHEETKKIIKDNVAKYAEKATPEDRVWLKMMTMEQFSRLTVVTMSDKVKEEVSKDIQKNTLGSKIKKMAESAGFYSPTSQEYEKSMAEVFRVPRFKR